jgi:hypothetical protein
MVFSTATIRTEQWDAQTAEQTRRVILKRAISNVIASLSEHAFPSFRT